MTDLDLKQALAPLFDDEPIHTSAATRVDAGRRALHRRRTTGLTALATAVVVTGISLVNLADLPSAGDGETGPATGGTSPSGREEPSTSPTTPTTRSLNATPANVLSPPAADRLTDQCRASTTAASETVKRRFFDDGQARLMASATSRTLVAGVYVSADGSMWAACVSGNTSQSTAQLDVFTTKRSTSSLVPAGSIIDEFCPTEAECYRVERVANQLDGVDVVRWGFSESDRTATVRTNRGWFVLLNAVPVGTEGQGVPLNVEYYDASGKRLAWANMRGASSYPGTEDFPSLSMRPEEALSTP